ncbi:MAG: polyprenyl synthetase family protein [Actinomycetota bacterium]|nr:polyprenyl synthetase family protein [Actinomycetota bacterium]
MTDAPNGVPAGAQGGPSWLVDDILRVEDLLLRTAGASGQPLVAEPSLHLLKAGGKRLRPALVLLSSHAGESGRRATDLAAAAIELVHIATLYHDDVLDETETRRGVPTTHAKWGTEVAVLAGDYLFACGSALGAEASGEVPGILARAIAAVCEGQIVETGSMNDPDRTPEQYLDTIRLKTAALFGAACDLGAATSDAGPDRRAALMVYGESLGLAFQVVDDLLDLIGDPRITGKEPGTDLREGVFTIPVLIGCQRDPSLARRLASGDRQLGSVLPSLEASGALTAALDIACEHGRRAEGALAELPDEEWAASLRTIITGVLAQVPDVSPV